MAIETTKTAGVTTAAGAIKSGPADFSTATKFIPRPTIISTTDKESNIPIVYINKITLDSTTSASISGEVTDILSVNLAMQLRIPVSNSLFSTQDDILKYLGIRITRDSGASPTLVYDGMLKDLASFGTSFLGEISLLTSGDQITVQSESGNSKYYLPFQVNDRLETPANLTYHVQCYLDLDDMAATLGIDFSSLGTALQTDGPISREEILVGGRVKTMADIYIVTSPFPEGASGTVWSGLVQQNSPTDTLWTSAQLDNKGLIEPTEPVLDLEKKQVRNSKIQDLRILKQLSSLNIDLTSENFFPITVKGTNTYNNSIPHPDAYISNAFLSRDLHNNCRFMFEFDYNKFLIEGSKFGKILTNPFVPESTKQKIYLYSKITNLEIIRRQVEVTRSYNRLNSPILGIHRSDMNYENKIIARTASDTENYNFLEDRKLYGPGITGNDNNTTIGRVAELAVIKNSPTTTRTISVTDNSAKNLTDGAYQYGVRLEVEDGTVRFLNERLRRLQTVRDYLVGYYNILQVPKTSFNPQNLDINIANVSEYYQKLFEDASLASTSTEDLNPTEVNKIISARTRSGKYNIAQEIIDIKTEMGITVGSLGGVENKNLTPWVVAPQYFVDTMETISDFKSVSPPMRNSTVRESSEAKYGDAATTAFTAATATAKITSSPTTFTDLFDEKTALFSFESLLDPSIATPQTVTSVIGAFDILIQKIRAMMGSSAEIDTFTSLVAQNGASKNARVSVLNLEDYFVELFDAQLSQMPSADRIGFVGSPGYVTPVSAPPAKITSFRAPEKEQVIDSFPGPLALTADEWNMRLDDERALYDESCLVKLTGIGPSVLDANSKLSKEAEFRERRIKLQQERVDARRRIQPPTTESDQGGGAVYLSSATIDSRKGQVIERSSNIVEAWNPEQYKRMQNTLVATSTGDFNPSSFTNQDTINHVMNKLGIEVKSQTTPMAAQVSLEAGSQKKKQSLLSAGTILGSDDLFVPGTRAVVNNECYGGGNGDGSINLEMCKNEASAQPITQAFMDIVATNGSLNRVAGKANGNQTTAAKIYNAPKSIPLATDAKSLLGGNSKALPSQTQDLLRGLSTGVLNAETGIYSPMAKFSLDDLAAVQVFDGYEKDSSGNIMIKKPNFITPEEDEWPVIIRGLKNSESYGAILCRFFFRHSAINQIDDGLNIVYTNTYFIITRSEASLFFLPPIIVIPPAMSVLTVKPQQRIDPPPPSGPKTKNIDLPGILDPDLGIDAAGLAPLIDPNQPSGTTFLNN